MLRSIYAMNLASVALVMFTMQIIWSCAGAKCHRLWKTVNALLAVLAVAAILYTTVFTRSPEEHEVKLRPFAALIAAKKQPELYRAMFMNILLFFPFGLSFSSALPGKRVAARMIVTALAGFLLSAAIEYAQFRYGLGVAEADDVICNTLGALVGSLSLIGAKRLE